MKSVSQITTWLNTPGSIKCILADISGVGGSPPSSNFYLSNLAYYDSIAGAMYNACINGNLSFSESLSADGSPSISNGSLEITNTGGVHDLYLTYVWRKRAIQIYLGDPSWPKSDFVLIFDGLVQDLTAPNENSLSFTLFDKLQRLNDPISETTLKSIAPTTTITVTAANITSNVATLTYATQVSAPFTFGQSITVNGIANFNGTFTVTQCTTTQVKYALVAANQTGTIVVSKAKVSNAPIYSQNTLSTILPLTFGECFNIQPLLVDNGSTDDGGQIYMYHNGSAQGIIEVRDNGIPITVSETKTKGIFELLTSPVGTITASVQGATTYTNTVAGIITQLVTEYGTAENRFIASEIDRTSFTNDTPVGVYCSDRRNIIEACAELAKSLNANLICPAITVSSGNVSTSKLKLIEIKVPTGTALYNLTDDNMVLNTLSITEMFPVKPSIKLGYCKNWSVQQAIAAGINPTSIFDEEYLYTTAVNTVAKVLYRDSGSVAEEPTVILQTADAATEAAKRLSLWETQRYLITATYLPELIFVQLGDIVQIKSARFNLSAGKLGMVYSLNKNWVTGLVEIGVLV